MTPDSVHPTSVVELVEETRNEGASHKTSVVPASPMILKTTAMASTGVKSTGVASKAAKESKPLSYNGSCREREAGIV